MSIKDTLITGAVAACATAVVVGTGWGASKLIGKLIDSSQYKVYIRKVDHAIAQVVDNQPRFTRTDLIMATFAAKLSARLYMSPKDFTKFEAALDAKIDEAIRVHYEKFVVTPEPEAN